ncbi:DUF2802 domain-containing protein [Chromobacterium vaccinii]|uniref:Uncharacterized protein n=1 Tax=Chromobacterium vaccinii TaxID=1108595 RepID=A0A1D9LGB5_9NEIS|nr:DUF2802 domain-containing protein [Chromobacterium vaccinii]AOZ50319.1 hypothetical protein BKX93_10120 [Chromobacterium vaccinii]MCD4483141.1 DUF2802 domain-containing protein [Chromobacterium vaccinii]MCD4499028.1 DUF2802 domain-containing protein [Chromobacterium vaccinii]QND83395.1 Uncharacterized protein ChrSW_1168 [Chromobacterium vaccinii]QND88626.1 Uncharacterized protein ChrSV_1168 [Chromobacterium vaccinii]
MSGAFFPYLMVLLWLALAAVVAYLYSRLQRLESKRDSVTSLYLDQLQQQISALQRDVSRLQSRAENRNHSDPGLSPYNQAIEMIRQGLTASEVASRCGISRSEAELIVSLYRNSPTS